MATENQTTELAALRKVLDASRCIRHWHDTLWNPETQQTEGMVVSAEHVRLLWAAIHEHDEATGAHAGER